MAIDTQHPRYAERKPDWDLLTDCYLGERRIKAQGTTYLAATSGQVAEGQGSANANAPGEKAYQAYKTRAVFHDFLRETVVGMMGIMHRKPPRFEKIPARLQPMLQRMTVFNESAALLWRRITEAQLVHGRMGLLVDVPDNTTPDLALPYVATYGAASVINWDAGLRRQGRQRLEFVVLDETTHRRRAELEWESEDRHRVLITEEALTSMGVENQEPIATGRYLFGLSRRKEPVSALTFRAPAIAGRALEEIPFVFVNPNDLIPDPDTPPLLGLANLCIAIYRLEADYRHSLFMQGQDTLYEFGVEEDKEKVVHIGAGARRQLPPGSDAKYVGVSGKGLPEMRQALDGDKRKAATFAVQLLDTRKGLAESGDALRVRVAAKTATLASLQLTAGGAIRECLLWGGRWLGISEDELQEIQVIPNLDFAEDISDPQAPLHLMKAVNEGLPLSEESIHRWLRDREFTVLDYEVEIDKVREERERRKAEGANGGQPGQPSEEDGGDGAPGEGA